MRKSTRIIYLKMVALAMVTTFSTLNGNISANTLQKELHSGWRFKQARLSNWYPATVPGVVHTDLIDNKIIEDPFYRLNERGVQWVDKEDWKRHEFTYTTDAKAAPELSLSLMIINGRGTAWFDDVQMVEVK